MIKYTSPSQQPPAWSPGGILSAILVSLSPGTRLGVYEITAQLGEGGMGQVYRATDTKLKRQVAIKILPPALAADADRLARFQREAEVLASLNHPNIAQIHGLEDSGDMTALVMELVEGEDLSQRIENGAIPFDEALPIARQIAEALEAAHEQGIIHRDFKPANIKVRADGTVKVLDFGLAKAIDQGSGIGDQGSGGAANSPTITTPAMTMRGVILGTAAYMSPEQAKGKAIDKRADIWAFGVVVYEMLTGRRAFRGDDVSETLASVLKDAPDVTALPASTPPRVRTVVARCLERDIRLRLRDIGEARIALSGAVEPEVPTRRDSSSRVAWAVAMVAVLAAIASATVWLRQPAPAPTESRVELVTPPTNDGDTFALSPDGTRIAYTAVTDGVTRLWVRVLQTGATQALAGTENAASPFWSPDSRTLGFFAYDVNIPNLYGWMKRVDAAGGAVRTVAEVPGGSFSRATWGAGGVMLYARGFGGVFRVPDSGGPLVPVTQPLAGQLGHHAPRFMPDGKHYVYLGVGNPSQLYFGSLDGGEPHIVTEADSTAEYLPSGWLFWVRQNKLLFGRFDPVSGTLSGDVRTLAEPVYPRPYSTGGGAFSTSASGLIAWRSGSPGNHRELAWFSREGVRLGTLGKLDTGDMINPALSPDGRRVAVARGTVGSYDIWLIDDTRSTRFTFDSNDRRVSVWAPDATRLVVTRRPTSASGPSVQGRPAGSGSDLYLKPVDASAPEQLLVAAAGTPTSWSHDGRWLLYWDGRNLMVLPMEGDRKPFAFSGSPFPAVNAVFSPDGKWVAYQSMDSGVPEVYVRPFPGPGGVSQISASGGQFPRWSGDGRELYYVAPGRTFMAAAMQIKDNALSVSPPVKLFTTDLLAAGGVTQYDVARDGRFLVIVEAATPVTEPIALLQNWTPPR